MSFLTLSKAKVQFPEQKFVLKIYMAAKALQTTKKVEIIDKKKFVIAVLNADNKTFVVHVVASVGLMIMPIYPLC